MLASNKPLPKLSPIANIESLASILEIGISDLMHIADNIEEYYKPGKILLKKDGSPRPTHDAKEPLKNLHEHIKNRILKKVSYPRYMLGGISDPEFPRSCLTHAAIHTGKATVISEDVANFFPSCTSQKIHEIWQYFFNFPPQIAALLAQLTTYKNELPQGWKTSSYLANLAFWDKEPSLVELLRKRGIAYSRFMDDITVSTRKAASTQELTNAISAIYSMMFSTGYKPKRSKHKISSRKEPIEITGLLANGKSPSVPPQYRQNVRAGVFQLSNRYQAGDRTASYQSDWNTLSGQVARIQSLHPNQGRKLRAQLRAIKV